MSQTIAVSYLSHSILYQFKYKNMRKNFLNPHNDFCLFYKSWLGTSVGAGAAGAASNFLPGAGAA
jgi:hypothetical protein